MSSDGTDVWVANDNDGHDGTVSEIDASTGKVVNTIPDGVGAGAYPDGVSSDGIHVWTSDNGGASNNTVTEFDASTGAVANTIAVGNAPTGVSSDGTHVWVANHGLQSDMGDTVSEIDASTGNVVKTITVGTEPYQLSSDGTHVWVANQKGGTVTEIDASTGKVVNTIPVGANPYGVSSDGTHVWVTNLGGSVSEIDASTGKVVSSISVGYGSAGVSSDGTDVWVANQNEDTVSEIDASTGKVVQTIPVGNNPYGVSSDGTHVWVTNLYGGTVSEIQISATSQTPTVSVTDDAQDSSPGDTVTFTATVTGSGGVTPTGAVTWALTDPDGNAVPCASSTGPAGSGSVATYTCSVNDVIAGPYAATATYPPDPNYNTASGTDTAKVGPAVALSDDSQPSLLSGNTVTFTATLTGSDGVPPSGPVTWQLTAPGGGSLPGCESTAGPTDSGGVATYTCSVARADAAEAWVSYDGDDDPRYGSTAPVFDDPAVTDWEGPPADKPPYEVTTTVHSLFIPWAVLAELSEDETLETSGTATNTLLAPAFEPAATIVPALPLGVTVAPSVGGLLPPRSATLSLLTGVVSPPADVSADPAFGAWDWTPPSLSEVIGGTKLRNGYYEFPAGHTARTITLSLTDLAPSSFTATLKDAADWTLKINESALDAVVVVAGVAVIVYTLPAGAVAAIGAAVGEAGEAAAGAIRVLGADLEQLIPVLPKRPSVLSSISNAVATKAAAVWNSLAQTSAAAAAAVASAPSVLSTNTTTAKVLKLRSADLHGLRAQRLRGALAKAAETSLLSLPTKTTIRPLIGSRRLPRGGRALTLLGGALAGTKAEIVIAGPGYTAVRDVRISHGLAGGRIILPRKRRAGRWYAGIIDYNALRTANGQLTGHTILEAATWTAR